MQESNESSKQLQQLVEQASLKWLVELVPLIWRLVAAVRLFFRWRDYAPVDGAV